MTELGLVNLVILPIGLGLLGFIEPCSIGSSLIFIKYLEGQDAGGKLGQVSVFAVTRALFIGLLGMAAVVVGSAFLGFQKAAWMVLGGIYIVLGLSLVAGKGGLVRALPGPRIARRSGAGGPAALGILFGLNIPACAGPLLVAVLGAAGASGAAGAPLAAGFGSLALFGFALSLPLVLAVCFAPARRALDRLAGLSARLPVVTGLILTALGLWSIGVALLAPVKT